jgi:hypothetical protein
MTDNIVNTYTNPTPSSLYTGQVGMTWNGDLYNFTSAGVQKYNNAGGFTGPLVPITVVSGPVWPGGAGDASEPFRPIADEGDAPATYDPVTGDPAVHERMDSIRLGNTWTGEWNKLGVTGVEDADDGLAYTPILNPSAGNYLAQVSVYNHSGVNATLIAWLDYNGNGKFDASEAITPITVASSTSAQSIYLYWPSAPTSLPIGSYTYLRIRVTRATNAMAAANATGYFFDGEVEDYKVNVDNYPLAVNLLSFGATAMNNSYVKLNWTVAEDADLFQYEIERSSDSRIWKNINVVGARGNNGTISYELADNQPYTGTSYYRLKLIDKNGSFRYSEVKTVVIKSLSELVTITPNPASTSAEISISNYYRPGVASLDLVDLDGKKLYTQKTTLVAGNNRFIIPIDGKWPDGTYLIRINTDKEIITKKLVIKK